MYLNAELLSLHEIMRLVLVHHKWNSSFLSFTLPRRHYVLKIKCTSKCRNLCLVTSMSLIRFFFRLALYRQIFKKRHMAKYEHEPP